MFFLLAASIIVIVLPNVVNVIRKNNRIRHTYEQVCSQAVWDNVAHDVSSPIDLPEEVDFFIINYTLGDTMYKVCRHSITVPQHLKTVNHQRILTEAIAVDDLGNIRNVTEHLAEYAGPFANFSGNDISLIDILRFRGIRDTSFVLTFSRDAGITAIFDSPDIQLHTNINVTVVH